MFPNLNGILFIGKYTHGKIAKSDFVTRIGEIDIMILPKCIKQHIKYIQRGKEYGQMIFCQPEKLILINIGYKQKRDKYYKDYGNYKCPQVLFKYSALDIYFHNDLNYNPTGLPAVRQGVENSVGVTILSNLELIFFFC
jgi:hypothetical protein